VTFAVSNQGISGNRLLGPGAGDAILARLDSDVLAAPGAEYMILFIGVNDLGVAYGNFSFGPPPGASDDPPPAPPAVPVTTETMTAAYRQVIDRAHDKGLKVFGATIAPYKGASYWSEEGEAIRQEVNAWIRESRAFDGMIDFDAAVRDPDDPAQFRDGYHMGDFLHGSPEGYAAMAESIDLSLFE
jgi:lysophospholipase L1-like esterase